MRTAGTSRIRFSIRNGALLLFLLLTLNLTFVAKPADAGPALVFDPATDIVVYAEDPDKLWHPASVTKLLTAYLVFEAIEAGKLKLDDKCKQSEVSIKEPPSKLGLPVGSEISVEMALYALMVKSANDVAVILAECVAGSKEAFVARMNETSKRLGMTRSYWVNPNGLPDEGLKQVTTARDMGLLARALLRDFPGYTRFYNKVYLKLGKRRYRNYNTLLRTYQGADGMKTGFICASGYNVVASATRNGRKLVAVVFGARSGPQRRARAAALLDHGFENYAWKEALFQTDIDEMARDGDDAKVAPNLRNRVCAPRRVVRRKLKKRRKLRRKQKRRRLAKRIRKRKKKKN